MTAVARGRATTGDDVFGLGPAGTIRTAVIDCQPHRRSVPTPSTSHRPRVGITRAVLALAALAAVLGLAVAPAGATVAQEPEVTVDPSLDPSASSTAPATGEETVPTSEAAPGGDTSTTPTASDGSSAVDDENRKVWMVVAGLVAVAIALIALTVWYWFRTRPVPVAEPTRARERAPAQKRAGSPPAVPVAPIGDDYDDLWVESEPSRMAVAGADHSTADADWEPRGTGEHDRVEPPPNRSARPSRGLREQAYRSGRARR